ncbi:hypothetical protein SEVIR_3G230900v4 [Setaria viridis]|uniref:Transcription repressor n=1 Tax=Setaria viridis TaxID=4556 RepID=A0A4U6VQX9_SETVI|nr:transcription repressor OFP8-like [Setaria viridis]TKW27037.1 hypothetical protein SEVIR_3G230900v2 [Setaria viridis]
MSLAGGWDRRVRGGSGRLELPRQQPPVVVDVGCTCRGARLLSSLISTLKSHARGAVGGKANSPHASSWSTSTTTTTAFTSSVSTTTATSGSSAADVLHSWGPATYAINTSSLDDYDDGVHHHDAEHARRQRRQRRRRRSSKCRRGQGRRAAAAAPEEEEEEAVAVAVEVESAAPYEDFRESMVAMVTEKEMYAWEDLNALLHQFLALNSPRHHPLILTAFADLWAPRGGLFCPPSPCLL